MPSNNNQSYCLEPARFKLDGGAMFGIIPRPLWNKLIPSDELNRIDLALRLWLIKKNDKLIIVDTGIGDYHGDKFDERFAIVGGSAPLKETLKEQGISPDQITDIVISHLHFDHVGGIAEKVGDEFVPLFKKATLHLHKAHYEYSLKPTARDTGSFHSHDYVPVVEFYKKQGQLHFCEGVTGEILPGLKFKCSHGHTPFLMHPYDEKYLYLADLIPTSHHIPIPWVMGYDIAPGVTTAEKAEFLEFVVKNNLTVIFEHDPEFWGATLESTPKGIAIKERFKADQKARSYSI
jgi:glyoxylase-like metal-dependent hydrolase (beta-lactamase superfamily II)